MGRAGLRPVASGVTPETIAWRGQTLTDPNRGQYQDAPIQIFLCLLRFFAANFSAVKPLTIHTCKLADEQASALLAALQARNWKPREVPYARFAFESDKTNIVFYESGKLVVQGKGTAEFVEFVLEPEILKQAKLGYETVLNPDMLLPRIGVDESGKGDFFGPLCIAGVYVNES